MAGKIKSITNPRLSLNVLSPEDVRRIHTATLDVIEQVGVRFPRRGHSTSGRPTAQRWTAIRWWSRPPAT